MRTEEELREHVMTEAWDEGFTRCTRCDRLINLDKEDTYYTIDGETVCTDCFDEETEETWRRLLA
jgi:recombinational DNA repair protein (RecF pathway)